MRICSLCQKEKELDQFGESSYIKKDGTKSKNRWCKQCYVKKAAEYQKLNPDKVKAWGTRKHRKKKYGMTDQEYSVLLEKQNNKCAICFESETHKGRGGEVIPLAVDHCHKTGVVRGLLCFKCNTAIGKFNDDPQILQNAIVYLIRSHANTEDANENS